MDRLFYQAISALLLTFIWTGNMPCFGQDYLHRPIKLNRKQQKLSDVMEEISKQGGFHFSYSSDILNQDSLVNLPHFQDDVQTALRQLLGDAYEFQQSPKHVIIRPTPFKLTLLPEEIGEGKKVYRVSGYVVDEKTGAGIEQASVYEKRLLAGTMTNKQGYFKLKLKSKDSKPLMLTVSKELYKDTTTVFLPTLDINGKGSQQEDYEYLDQHEEVSSSGVSKFLLSSRQKLNALNLGNFFAYTPVQVSLIPGLSSHGMMSSQIVNKFSYNLIGGYTAGVNGMELAGIFNINRFHVRYAQYAGIFNVVGGTMSGLQLAGISNKVIDSLRGVQMAGIQNITLKQVKGLQLAGLLNYTEQLKGIQIAGLVNKTNNNRGVQFGIVNLADTSSGISIGLINWIGDGIRRLSLSSNEVNYAQLNFRSGNAKLYSILSAGYGTWNGKNTLSAGFGLGHEFTRAPGKPYFATELINQQLYASSYKDVADWPKWNLLYYYPLHKKIQLYVGPSLNFLIKNKQAVENGTPLPWNGYPDLIHGERSKLWIGLDLGISLF